MNSRRVRSVVHDRYGLYDPNEIRLYRKIEQQALSTILVAPITVTNGFSWNEPARHMNSPAQLTLIPGVPILAVVNTKNIALNIGISVVSPRQYLITREWNRSYITDPTRKNIAGDTNP